MNLLQKVIPTEEEKQSYVERHGDVLNTVLTAMLGTPIRFVITIAAASATVARAALRLLELIGWVENRKRGEIPHNAYSSRHGWVQQLYTRIVKWNKNTIDEEREIEAAVNDKYGAY